MGDWAAFLWSPLAAAIVAAAVSYLVSRRSIYINSVTVERSKWIGELRSNISILSSQVLSINHILVDGRTIEHIRSEEFQCQAKEIHRLTSLIKLQLNPFGEIDKHILQIIDDLEQSFQNPTDFSWAGKDYLLIAHAQYLLKAEWEKVKLEAAGPLRKPWLWVKSKLHMRRYRQFVKDEM